jgi:hypothetical protein
LNKEATERTEKNTDEQKDAKEAKRGKSNFLVTFAVICSIPG